MRGEKHSQGYMFTYLFPEDRVPSDHPLRKIRKFCDQALSRLSRQFDEMYSRMGRPSIPPETLLKSQLLIALYSVRSDRLFCETLDYNILFRWFLDMDLESPSFDASTFSKNRDRLMGHEVSRRFFDAVVRLAREEGLLSDEHFSVDGTLIEAWASLKSFRKEGEPASSDSDNDPSNPTVNFHGEKRSNETHKSTTDPDARLMRKGPGKEAKLSYTSGVLMENRNGLCVDIAVAPASNRAERTDGLDMIRRYRSRTRRKMKTLAGDKGYCTKHFVKSLRELNVAPHVAQRKGWTIPGLDGRTTQRSGYRTSMRVRKRVEEIFGWFKLIGGFRKTRFRGLARVQEHGYMVATAYNLLRMGKLAT